MGIDLFQAWSSLMCVWHNDVMIWNSKGKTEAKDFSTSCAWCLLEHARNVASTVDTYSRHPAVGTVPSFPSPCGQSCPAIPSPGDLGEPRDESWGLEPITVLLVHLPMTTWWGRCDCSGKWDLSKGLQGLLAKGFWLLKWTQGSGHLIYPLTLSHVEGIPEDPRPMCKHTIRQPDSEEDSLLNGMLASIPSLATCWPPGLVQGAQSPMIPSPSLWSGQRWIFWE